jgi:hypothetical protein
VEGLGVAASLEWIVGIQSLATGDFDITFEGREGRVSREIL